MPRTYDENIYFAPLPYNATEPWQVCVNFNRTCILVHKTRRHWPTYHIFNSYIHSEKANDLLLFWLKFKSNLHIKLLPIKSHTKFQTPTTLEWIAICLHLAQEGYEYHICTLRCSLKPQKQCLKSTTLEQQYTTVYFWHSRRWEVWTFNWGGKVWSNLYIKLWSTTSDKIPGIDNFEIAINLHFYVSQQGRDGRILEEDFNQICINWYTLMVQSGTNTTRESHR